LSFTVSADIRLPQLNAVSIPEGIDEASLREQLLKKWQIEIGAGLGSFAGKVWRIGLMGQSACQSNVLTLLAAMASCLTTQGLNVDSQAAIKAASQVYEVAAG